MMSDEQRAADDVMETSGPEQPEPEDPGPDPAKPREPEKPRSGWSFVTEMAVLIGVALTVALLIKTFIVQPFYIPSGSMENTLLVGDKILVNKVVYHLRPVGRGDIVVFSGAGSWDQMPPAAPASGNPVVRVYDDTLGRLFHAVAGLFGTPLGQTDYVKRVIGIPGDHVQCCNAQGQITVNGVALREQAYLVPGAVPSLGHFSVVVPPGRLFVMGDNRPDSADSRLKMCGYTEPTGQRGACLAWDPTGTVPENMVVGRVFMIVWPPSRMQIVRVPATFGQSVQNHPGGAAGTAAAGAAVSYLPLAAGVAVAAPLPFARRRMRRSLAARRARRGRGAQARRLHAPAGHRADRLRAGAGPRRARAGRRG